jgi:hypothetical protein
MGHVDAAISVTPLGVTKLARNYFIVGHAHLGSAAKSLTVLGNEFWEL